MSFFHYELDSLVPQGHAFRKFKAWLPVEGIAGDWEELKKGLGREGYGWEAGIRALFLQFHGDHSDREMEEQLRYNMLYRWFCGFAFEEATPDHTYFCRVRRVLGADRVSRLFEKLLAGAKERKLVKGLEVFVDASAIKRKEATWAERDRAKAAGESGQGNAVISRYAADGEARWGCKRKMYDNGKVKGLMGLRGLKDGVRTALFEAFSGGPPAKPGHEQGLEHAMIHLLRAAPPLPIPRTIPLFSKVPISHDLYR